MANRIGGLSASPENLFLLTVLIIFFHIQILADTMKMTWLMEGCVNGHAFTIEGEGTGKPYE